MWQNRKIPPQASTSDQHQYHQVQWVAPKKREVGNEKATTDTGPSSLPANTKSLHRPFLLGKRTACLEISREKNRETIRSRVVVQATKVAYRI